MPVGVGERAGVAPRLLRRLADDPRPRPARALDRLVDVGLQAQHAFAVTGLGDLVVTDHPAEAPAGHEQEVHALVQHELQRLGHAVGGRLAEGLEAEALAVEAERRLPIGDRQADGDRAHPVVESCAPSSNHENA
jgi:hypothetical protein